MERSSTILMSGSVVQDTLAKSSPEPLPVSISATANTANRRLFTNAADQAERWYARPFHSAEVQEWVAADNMIGAAPDDAELVFPEQNNNIDQITGREVPFTTHHHHNPRSDKPTNQFQNEQIFHTLPELSEYLGHGVVRDPFHVPMESVAFNQPQFNLGIPLANLSRTASTQNHVNGLLFSEPIEPIGSSNVYNRVYHGVDILSAFNLPGRCRI